MTKLKLFLFSFLAVLLFNTHAAAQTEAEFHDEFMAYAITHTKEEFQAYFNARMAGMILATQIEGEAAMAQEARVSPSLPPRTQMKYS